MSNFKQFSRAVNARFKQLAKTGELYVVDVDGDALWQHYLAAFPEGSNPLYRAKTEHDCSCCRNFIKHVGAVVAIRGVVRESLWDLADLPSPYREVAAALHDVVQSKPLQTIFRKSERQYGAEKTRQIMATRVIQWDHLWVELAAPFHVTRSTTSAEEQRGEFHAAVQVFRRGLTEITPAAIQQVLELIASNALYRGSEHQATVKAFRKLQQAWGALAPEDRPAFEFTHAMTAGARVRNAVIGTLLIDLSEGVDVERAVRSFEEKVAPTNYQRPTAAITSRMVDTALQALREQGLEASIPRRLATLADVSVNNVLWVSGDARARMKDGLAALLESAIRVDHRPSADPAREISIADFMTHVLPQAKRLEALVTNEHLSAFVTVTTAVHPESPPLFKWNNRFAWSYAGDVTDSIRERVKRAGGNVNAALRFSLSWGSYNDLDIHVRDPLGKHIYYADKGGVLDVDMNAGSGTTREPVENLAFTAPRDGVYEVWVHQYMRREAINPGFSIEVADTASTRQYRYAQDPTQGQNVMVGKFMVQKQLIVKTELGPGMLDRAAPVARWGITTEQFVPVATLMFSPNYWDEQAVGNQHWFFILEGCRTDEPARGIYNEFLDHRLIEHRKVLEVLGARTQCPPTESQLSGIGFSSTRRATLTVAVINERSRRLFQIQF
ncbi:MAG: hypothetical protein MUE46_18490 [Xanthomonadales bacterium]|jgi:hypothetical protein|nr:hypothetical protein [Xanthomonadales bacterium]